MRTTMAFGGRLIPIIASAAGAILLAGGGASSAAAPAAPAPPPQLWSMEVVAERAPGRPVQICVDKRLRSGFATFTFQFGGKPCAIDHIYRRATGQNYKCSIGDKQYGVATTLQGATDSDFTASTAVTDLDTSKTVYSRVMRYRRLGPCPSGWPVGDATDQSGRRGPSVTK